MNHLRVFIGFDEREAEAASVAVSSLRTVTGGEIEPELLNAPKLYDQGLLWRPVDQRGPRDYDLVSNALTSTRFKYSRFLVPILCQQGPALFVDCDVVFRRDPREMMSEVKSRHAVSVVKHRQQVTEQWKMGDQVQVGYPRKNWSSVMLFNCDHAANRRLSLRDVNERTDLALHGFYWLSDAEIGDLAPRWNVLIGVQELPPAPGILHYTLGGPFTPRWRGGPHDDLWRAARDAMAPVA